MEPVFCGISGATRTTCTGSGGGKPDPPPADGQHDLGAGTRLRVAHEVVVGGPQPAGFVGAALHAAVEDVLGADAQCRRVEELAGLVVQHDGEALLRATLDRRHHPRRVLDDDVGPVLAQLEPGPPVGQHLEGAAEEPADGAVREELAAAVLERAGEAARPVVEDTQADDLSAERVGVRLGVLVSDTEEDAEPASDAADELTAHRDPRLGHALHDGPHGAVKARLAADVEKTQSFRTSSAAQTAYWLR